jgi:hypothetical protein
MRNYLKNIFRVLPPKTLRNLLPLILLNYNVEAAAILDKGVSSIADITTKSSRLAELAKTTNLFATINDTARRTAVAAYSSAGEASFEALQTANEFRNNLIEKYKLENYGQEYNEPVFLDSEFSQLPPEE